MDYPKSVPGVGLVGGKFIDENAVSGIMGSLIPAAWGNAVTDELLAVLVAAGIEPDESDHAQLLAALRVLFPGATQAKVGVSRFATVGEAKLFESASLGISPATLGAVLGSLTSGIPGATFAELSALTEDVGPLICTDMAGDLYTWTDTAFFTGYRNPRSGLWYGGASDTPEAWELPARGGVWLESDPKHKRVIARYREWGRVKAVADWAAKWNFIADLGGGEWKAPDLRDVFQRMDGTDADTANARTAGAYKSASLKEHDHGGRALDGLGPAGTGSHALRQYSTGIGALAASAVAPFGGSETRPESTAVTPVILV
jgi:hypothetical protein